jgi:signal peptidase I
VTPSARYWVQTGFRTVERFLAVFGLGALIYFTCFDFSIIISGSMSPALQGNDAATGDRILFEKLTDRLRAPRRWEIHQFHTPEGLTVAKRIVGLPGERISLHDGVLLINGKPLPIPARLAYLHYYPLGNLAKGNEVSCGSGYFVLGDDSRDSFDSRYEGVLTVDRFTARAWLILGPTRFGFVR